MNKKIKSGSRFQNLVFLKIFVIGLCLCAGEQSTRANSLDLQQTSNVCKEDYKVIGNTTQIQMGNFDADSCFISIDPFNNLDMIYRSYILVTDSTLMIFNSYGNGPLSTSTGARELLFFPRRQSLNYQIDGQNLNIEMNGMNLVMNTANTQFLKMDGVEFEEAPKVSRDNQGGIKILSTNRLYLDLGFKLGSAPRAEQNRKVQFHDAHDWTCELTNNEIFDYSKDAQNPIFKFASDSDLSQFLKVRCPQLTIF